MKKLICLLVIAFTSKLQAQKNITPKPHSIEIRKGEYILTDDLTIQYDEDFPEIECLKTGIKSITGKDFSISHENSEIILSYLAGPKDMNPESYILTIHKDGINIASPSNKGISPGIRTLLQIIEEYQSELKIPYLEIKD